jgi:2-desacetyl-2-hydroxyethyl bacteriochlorophyllide A dehydrogenase
MRTIVLDQPRQLSVVDRPVPRAPEPGEALVRVHRIGICGTDLHAYQGNQPFFTYPRVLGHELGVEVVEVDDDAGGPGNIDGIRAGDRCAVEPYLSCGACIACRAGLWPRGSDLGRKTNCCVRLQVLGVHADGGMRELITVPVRALHRSDTLSLDQLALVEPLCVGAHAVARADVEAGECVLVIGAGPIGLSVIQFASLAGAKILVMDVNRDRLAFAREHFQVEAVIESGEGGIELVRALTDGDMPTVVFDATGDQRSMTAAFDLPAHGGRLVFVGLFQGDVTFHDPAAHRRELTLLCSRNATAPDFRRVIGLLESGRVATSHWISHRVPFGDEVVGGFPRWLDPQSRFIKAVIDV